MPKRNAKRNYISTKKRQKKEAKDSTDKDMAQDYRLKEVEKKVAGLDKATKGWSSVSSAVVDVLSLVGEDATNLLSVVTLQNPLGQVRIQDNFFTVKHIGFNYEVVANYEQSMEEGPTSNVRIIMLVVHAPPLASVSTQSYQPPRFSDLFQLLQEDAGPRLMDASDVMAHYNRQNRANFEILYDKIHTLIPPIYSADPSALFPTNKISSGVIRVDLRPSKRSEGVSVSSVNEASPLNSSFISKNAYYLLAFSDRPSTETTESTITFNIIADILE